MISPLSFFLHVDSGADSVSEQLDPAPKVGDVHIYKTETPDALTLYAGDALVDGTPCYSLAVSPAATVWLAFGDDGGWHSVWLP